MHALVDLKQMRMRLADADPNNLRSALCGKCSDSGDEQKERAELDRAESFPQPEVNIFLYVSEKAEGQMHLIGLHPTDTANVWIKTCKQSAR